MVGLNKSSFREISTLLPLLIMNIKLETIWRSILNSEGFCSIIGIAVQHSVSLVKSGSS